MELTTTINKALQRLKNQQRENTREVLDNINDEAVYIQHAKLIKYIGDDILKTEGKEFTIDDSNKHILRFLLYYFNGSDKCLTCVESPNIAESMNNNIILVGEVGTGKTLMMQVFSEYLRLTGNKYHQFDNLSVTQMVNYYKLHNHLDNYTYREDGAKNFDGNPINICLNDVGMQTHKHFGTDTKTLIIDYLHARNEIWAMQHKFAHITTNLTIEEIKGSFDDGHGRLIDRFKTYNVLYLTGKSRR